MPQPYLFILDASADDVPDPALAFFTGALLTALWKSDPEACVSAELRGGLPGISDFAEKITVVSRTERTFSHTRSHDMELYKTLLVDMTDALCNTWASADADDVLDVLRRRQSECLALSDLPNDIRDKLDARLKEIPGYIGAFALDPESPIQRDAFYDSLMHFAVINGGTVVQELSIEGDPDWPLEGAANYQPGGLVWKPHFWRYDEPFPKLAKTRQVSARGEQSLQLLRDKRQRSIEGSILSEIARSNWSDRSGGQYKFEAVERHGDILQAILPEGKFTKYLFDMNHKDGRGKAKFFVETLRFSPDDWRYLAAQFYEGLVKSQPRDLDMRRWPEGYGARFNVVIRVKSRTGETGKVRTGWMLRPNALPSLSTAIPEDQDIEAIDPGIPPIARPDVCIEEFWRSVFDLAEAEAVAAYERAVPTPLFIPGQGVIREGEWGGATIIVKDARKGFARWLLKNGLAEKEPTGGASIACASQSYDRSFAYAKAFARVLVLNGVPASVDVYDL